MPIFLVPLSRKSGRAAVLVPNTKKRSHPLRINGSDAAFSIRYTDSAPVLR